MNIDFQARKLYDVMHLLGSSVDRIGEFWNDRVATAISVNMVNDLINCCNSMNADMVSLSVDIKAGFDRLESLVNEPD